jgi:hypothetical protein
MMPSFFHTIKPGGAGVAAGPSWSFFFFFFCISFFFLCGQR